MGSHRADHRASRRRSAPRTPAADTYVGKRVAGRAAPVEGTPLGRDAEGTTPVVAASTPLAVPAPSATPLSVTPLGAAPVTAQVAPAVETVISQPGKRRAVVPTEVVAPTLAEIAVSPVRADRSPTVELPDLGDIPLFDPLTDSSATSLRAVKPAGKRRAVRHAGRRGSLFRGLPSMPVAVGVAAIAVAVGGVVTTGDTQLAASTERVAAANALTGSLGNATYGTRGQTVSRDSDRDALAQANGTELVEQVERDAEERNSALGALARDAEKEAAEIALNRWVVPIDPGSYRLTATYGQYGLWSSYHTGLDFAAPSGTPIRAVANGVVTSVGSDGAYGNKTVITLEDGTEIWFCHQTSYNVSEGDTVRGGDVIGYVGSTGNSTGPHLHLEVRPGGGDPVDPDAALRVHGVTP